MSPFPRLRPFRRRLYHRHQALELWACALGVIFTMMLVDLAAELFR